MLTIAKALYGKIRRARTSPKTERGKSAIVANKIVATIHSTAGPSLFLHAASAIHGDLGMMQNGAPVRQPPSRNTPESLSLFSNVRIHSLLRLVKSEPLLAGTTAEIAICGRMPSLAFSIKKIVSNNQQGGFIAYVARGDNEFIQPASETMTKIPTSAYRNHFAGEEWPPQSQNSLPKDPEIHGPWGWPRRPHQRQ